MTNHQAPSLRPVDAAILRRPLACRDCSYDLRGLPLGGACPECGTPIWHTVLRTIDPETSRLPRLRNPRAVGNGLFLVACFLLFVPLLLGLGPALRGISGLFSWSEPSPAIVDRFGLLAAAISFAGLFAAKFLSPAREDRLAGATRRRLLGMALGFAITGTSILVLVLGGWYRIRLSGREWFSHEAISLGVLAALILGGMMVVAIAFGGLLRTVGERSREYRTNLVARQRTTDLAIALGVVLLAEVVRLTASASSLTYVALSAATIAIAAFSMTLIGLAYLALNCFWIRRSLRRPPLTIVELISPPPAPPADAVPAESSAGTAIDSPADSPAESPAQPPSAG